MKFLSVTSIVLCFLAIFQVSQGEFDLQQIKLKDILGGMFQNVRHVFLEGLQNSTYQWNWLHALDLFTDRLTVGDLLESITDGGQQLINNLLESNGEAFNDTGIQKEIVDTFKYLVRYGTFSDILAIFTGSSQDNLWKVITQGMQLSFQNSTALKEMSNEFDIFKLILTNSNKGAQTRLKEQNDKSA